MVSEVITHLDIKPDGCYIDVTYGRGGHSKAILKMLNSKGKLIALDQDPEAAKTAKKQSLSDERFHFHQCNFEQLEEVAKSHRVASTVSGVLLDAGVSSPQLDDPQRGFSFQKDGPLDMRMNPQAGISARQWLIEHTEEQIADALWNYAGERHSRKIASHIKNSLDKNGLETTLELADLISTCVRRERKKHPATRSFLALRIAVNDEINTLNSVLKQAYEILQDNGRLAIISFHSLEHKIVKNFHKVINNRFDIPRGLPVPDMPIVMKKITKVTPSKEELLINPRARSAQLTIFEKQSKTSHVR